jgi:hypothetical protein
MPWLNPPLSCHARSLLCRLKKEVAPVARTVMPTEAQPQPARALGLLGGGQYILSSYVDKDAFLC